MLNIKPRGFKRPPPLFAYAARDQKRRIRRFDSLALNLAARNSGLLSGSTEARCIFLPVSTPVKAKEQRAMQSFGYPRRLQITVRRQFTSSQVPATGRAALL